MTKLLTWFVRWLSRLLGLQPPRRQPQRTPWNDTSDPSIGWTYHIYDREGTLLYIGSSKHHPFARLADHATKPWWPLESSYIHIFKWANYSDSHTAEILAIRSLNPRHNKVRYTSVASPDVPRAVAIYEATIRRTH